MHRWLALTVSVLLLGGCEEEKTAPVETVRALKTTIAEVRAAQQQRQISGVVGSEVVSDLSFEISGKIISLPVEIGDVVGEGDEIARLDQEPYRLRVQTAQSVLTEAQARLRDAREKHEQQETLFKQGFTTKTNYDRALADYEAAQSSVEAAKTQLEIARRDIRNTILRAPFAGRIAERNVDTYNDVAAGSKVVRLQDETALNVEVSLPETLISFVRQNDPVTVRFPTLLGAVTQGRISDIGSQTGDANAFPVKIALTQKPAALKPGMTAEAMFKFDTAATGGAFLLPNTALLVSDQPSKAYIFVYDAERQVVRRREVNVLNIFNNDVEVSGDIKAGEHVAVAGVSFLADEMKVKLLAEQN